MNIDARMVSGKYLEVTVSDGVTQITTGLMDKSETLDVAKSIIYTAAELLCASGHDEEAGKLDDIAELI